MTTGHLFHPAYDYLYQLEARGYPRLGYHPDWAIEDPRYLPQNLGDHAASPPDVLPDRAAATRWASSTTPVCTEPGATRGLFDVGCPLAVPRDIGMSVLLTSPAFLLASPALARLRAQPARDRRGPRDRR